MIRALLRLLSRAACAHRWRYFMGQESQNGFDERTCRLCDREEARLNGKWVRV